MGKVFARQFVSPLIHLLFVAVMISFAMGRHRESYLVIIRRFYS